MNSRLLLLDGHSLAYRAFFALPIANFTTSNGQPTNAIYGFAAMLINLIREERPTHIAIAFDVSRKTFRSEKFPDYKANRAKTPDEFKSQLPYISELVSAFGIPKFEMAGFEADDLIATISTKAIVENFDVLICTGDRDSFQLVTDKITVLYPKKGVTELARMTPDAVIAKYGLTPAQYSEFAALRGDPSDNLPAVPGVGEKTATKLIQDYGSIKSLIARIDEIGGKVGDSIRANIHSIITNRELTELIHDVPINCDLVEWPGINLKQTSAIFEELEIKTLKERVKSLKVDGSDLIESQSGESVKYQVTEIDQNQVLAHIAGPITLVYSLVDREIVEYAIAVDKTNIFHVKSSNLAWLSECKQIISVHDARPILHLNSQVLIGMDTHLAAYLISPGSRSLSLAEILEKYLGTTLERPSETLFDQSGFEPRTAGQLAQLSSVLTNELANRGLSELFTKIEIPTLRILCEMEKVGIAVDRERLMELSRYFAGEVARESANAYQIAGREFNVASPKQLQSILFDELKLPKTKKIKTGYTTDADALDWLYEKTENPILKSLQKIREAGKLRAVVEGLLTATATDGRIHTTFQQTVAATGRLSSTDPNLQNIPIRTEDGRKIRDAFIAKEPFVSLLTADYSQIELRIMAHLSEDSNLIKALKSGEDLHNTVASEVFGISTNEVTPEMRRQIKAMSYGLAYGLSSFGLAQQLNITPGEASELMSKYFERFGGIRNYLKSVVEIARSKGYTETILGRRRYLPDLTSENKVRREIAERMALNAPIQGSAADIIKLAMIKVADAMKTASVKSRLLLQVHDELIFEIAPHEEETMAELVQKEMGNAFSLSVPLAVNLGFGSTWNLADH